MQTPDVGASEREVLREQAYGEPSKLLARQKLWTYVERTWTTGRISSALELNGGETIVDVGCGNGRDLLALRADGHTGPVVAVDFSVGMLASVPGDVALRVNADAVQLLAASSADVVCAMHMLYHLPDIPSALQEAKRVLRSSGTFLCSTNSEDAVPELLGPWSAAMEAVGAPRLERQSHTAFSVESAPALLADVFSTVELRRTEVVARVPSADVVRDYVASTDDLYQPQLPDPSRWGDVLDRVHRHAAEVISRTGTFDITQRAGIFVCR